MENNYEKFLSSLMESEIKKLKEKKKAEKKTKRIKKIKKKLKRFKKIKPHTRRVVKLCKKLCKKLLKNSCEIKDDILINAAWIHDVGKVEDKEFHHLPIILKKVVPVDLHDDVLFEIVEQHRDLFNPQNHCKECAVLRLCDKIDKFHKTKHSKEKIKEVKKRCKEVIDDIKYVDCFGKSDIKILKKFVKSRKKKAGKCLKKNKLHL